jgi:hypothetical protein
LAYTTAAESLADITADNEDIVNEATLKTPQQNTFKENAEEAFNALWDPDDDFEDESDDDANDRGKVTKRGESKTKQGGAVNPQKRSGLYRLGHLVKQASRANFQVPFKHKKDDVKSKSTPNMSDITISTVDAEILREYKVYRAASRANLRAQHAVTYPNYTQISLAPSNFTGRPSSFGSSSDRGRDFYSGSHSASFSSSTITARPGNSNLGSTNSIKPHSMNALERAALAGRESHDALGIKEEFIPRPKTVGEHWAEKREKKRMEMFRLMDASGNFDDLDLTEVEEPRDQPVATKMPNSLSMFM